MEARTAKDQECDDKYIKLFPDDIDVRSEDAIQPSKDYFLNYNKMHHLEDLEPADEVYFFEANQISDPNQRQMFDFINSNPYRQAPIVHHEHYPANVRLPQRPPQASYYENIPVGIVNGPMNHLNGSSR